MFQISLRSKKCVAARHSSVIGNKLLFANNRNRVRWVVLCLSQDRACTDSFENFREYSLKGDISNDITLNPPLFSLVNTFKPHWPTRKILKTFHVLKSAIVLSWSLEVRHGGIRKKTFCNPNNPYFSRFLTFYIFFFPNKKIHKNCFAHIFVSQGVPLIFTAVKLVFLRLHANNQSLYSCQKPSLHSDA